MLLLLSLLPIMGSTSIAAVGLLQLFLPLLLWLLMSNHQMLLLHGETQTLTTIMIFVVAVANVEISVELLNDV